MAEIRNWSVSDALQFLDTLNLTQYKKKFLELKIDGHILINLTQIDLTNDLKIQNPDDCLLILQSINRMIKYKELKFNTIKIKCCLGSKIVFYDFLLKDIIIGNDPKCDICLPNISNFHCVLKYESSCNRFLLQDLHSKTGTFLEMQTHTPLAKNMIFTISGHKFIIKNI